MEFVCVMSVQGRLLSYDVRKQQENKYLARLRQAADAGYGWVKEIILERVNGRWRATPEQPEVADNLVKCIDGG